MKTEDMKMMIDRHDTILNDKSRKTRKATRKEWMTL